MSHNAEVGEVVAACDGLVMALKEYDTFGAMRGQSRLELDSALARVLSELAVQTHARGHSVRATALVDTAGTLIKQAEELLASLRTSATCTCGHPERDHCDAGCWRDTPGGADVCPCVHRNGLTDLQSRTYIEGTLGLDQA
ncbi:hypothetical protein [Solicola sp. PLA-1-18]|uniref:hypothetical protein n=1 Tax=Solicola sp. PLA-1-18 TaxID=3380532 RepID=UPI003B7B5FAB